MNFNSESIPQLTYDIIARILPGLFFISLLFLSATGIGEVVDFESKEEIKRILLLGYIDVNFSFFNSIMILFFSYLLGWTLYKEEDKFSFGNDVQSICRNYSGKIIREKLVSQLLEIEIPDKKNDAFQAKQESIKELLKEMYHYIRIVDSRAGLRLVKLRAENRMWDSLGQSITLIGLICIFILSIPIITIYCPIFPNPIAWGKGDFLIQNAYWFIIKFTVIILVWIAIFKQYKKLQSTKRLWKKYWKNIASHYCLIKLIQKEEHNLFTQKDK